MAEPIVPAAPNAPGGGIQPVAPPEPQKTFTQAELDAVISERLRRERERYQDYDALKKKASDYDKLTESQKDELTKAQERAAKAEADRDQALRLANERIIQAAFVAEAAKLGVVHPQDAFALADRSAVTIDDNGNVTGADKAVAQLVKDGRIPTKAAQPPDINAQNQGGKGVLTAEELRQKKLATGMYSKM